MYCWMGHLVALLLLRGSPLPRRRCLRLRLGRGFRLRLRVGLRLRRGLAARCALRLLLRRRLGLRRSGHCSRARRLQRDRDVTHSLADPGRATSCTRAPTLDRRPLVDVDRLHDEVVADQVVVRLGVRDRGAQELVDLARRRALAEREHRPRFRNGPAADVLDHEPRLAGRDPHPLRGRLDFLHLRGTHVVRFTSTLRSPECARNVRVGANSPSLCPTICSVTNTGTCLRPSWTAIVCPTISGKIVDVRDQVRTRFFEPDAFIDSMRLNRRSSTYGPFLELRLISSPCRGGGRGRSGGRIPCASSGCASRASAPPTG